MVKRRGKKEAEARFSGILKRRADTILSSSEQFQRWMRHAHLKTIEPMATRIKYTLSNDTLLLTMTFDCKNGKLGALIRINSTFAVLDGISDVVHNNEEQLKIVEDYFQEKQATWIEEMI